MGTFSAPSQCANPIFLNITFLPFHAMQLVTPSAVAMADSTLMAV